MLANDWQGKDALKLMDTSKAPEPGTLLPCLLCAKMFMMQRYVGVPDQVCPDCYVTYRDCARLVCRTCKITIAKIHPHVMDNGFSVKAGAVLHSTACNICRPGIKESVVVEVELWNQMRRPTKMISTPNKKEVMQYGRHFGPS